MPNIAELRREYSRAGLDEHDVAADPIAQFEAWFEQAVAAGVHEPNAMTLATAIRNEPNARTVLLKGVSREGFVFYTNYASAKGRELEANPRAALLFLWHELERQVRVCGAVERVSREASAAYFATRPRGAQLGAWASEQSRPIASRKALEDRLAAMEKQFEGKEIPVPPTWGGYVVRHEVVEFWQGRPNRLHDRIVYARDASDPRRWIIERLCP
jgi:pyridoxamine 5'-phosphate oxidase